jgi:hypothetical protein
VPRFDTTVGSHARLRHVGHTGAGGWTSALQSWQPWIGRWPSAPEVQNHSLSGVTWGSGRTERQNVLDRNSTAGVAAGNDPEMPALK